MGKYGAVSRTKGFFCAASARSRCGFLTNISLYNKYNKLLVPVLENVGEMRDNLVVGYWALIDEITVLCKVVLLVNWGCELCQQMR